MLAPDSKATANEILHGALNSRIYETEVVKTENEMCNLIHIVSGCYD